MDATERDDNGSVLSSVPGASVAAERPNSPAADLGVEVPLKIALVHAADFGGGAERSVLSLHLALRELGHESRLYVGYKLTEAPGVFEIDRTRTVPGLLRGTRWLERRMGWQDLYAPGFRRMVRSLEADTDVVHLHSLWGSSGYADLGALPALSRRFPTLVTLRESWLMTGHCACPFECVRWKTGCGKCPDLTLAPRIARDGTRFNWRRKRALLQRSRVHVTAVSAWLAAQAKQSPILEGHEISVVHNGVDERVFMPGSRAQAREQLGISQDRFVVLFAGQSIEGINQGIAQHAVEAVDRCRSDRLLALLVGTSAARVQATMRAPSQTLPFQDGPEAMARCYRAADVTIVPSEYESFGRVAAESQACGTPVVAFSTGGLPEVVQHGVGGLIVPRLNVDALTAALQRLHDDPAYRQQLGEQGALDARTRFANATIASRYIALYRRLVAARAVR